MHEEIYTSLLSVFAALIEYAILAIEAVGVSVLLCTVGRAALSLLRGRGRVRLLLAEGIALSLEFKVGAELLRTLIVRSWNEILILGAVILLRAALTFLIEWELRDERQAERERRAEEKAAKG